MLAAVLHWTVLSKGEAGRDAAYAADLGFWIMLLGIVGARIAYVLVHFRDFAAEPISILRIDQGGLTYFGGFVTAALGVSLILWMRGRDLWAETDFAITAVPLAHALGRVGCFLNGCCFGRVWNGPWAVRFPQDSLPWHQHCARGWLEGLEGLV